MRARAKAFALLLRKLRWRVRWLARRRSLLIDPWIDGLRIELPKTGTTALVYYHGSSDAVLAQEVERAVQPGTTYVDIGAHVGEYALRAARATGASGHVYAVEPNPFLADSVERNVVLNGLRNVSVRQLAVGAESVQLGFHENERSRGGWLAPGSAATYTVECVTLDRFVEAESLARIDVLKLDAAGGEVDVLRGAEQLLDTEALPHIIVKLYDPATVRERFGRDAFELVDVLLEHGYGVEAAIPGSRVPVRARTDVEPLSRNVYSVVLVAHAAN